jgi:lipase
VRHLRPRGGPTIRLNVREFGDAAGTPVLCLHGLTGYGGRFRRLADAALPGRHVLGIDLRGHGHSGWDPPWDLGTHVADLLETADDLGIERADWLGHSVGGRLIAELAAVAPDRVERAVLLDPAMHVDPETAVWRVGTLLADTSFATVDELIDARLSDPLLYSTPRSILEAEAEEHAELGDDGRYRWRFSRGMAIVAWSEMTRAAPPWPGCPSLVVVGARSWIPLDIPDAAHLEQAVVPGGHSVLWDDFDATAETIAGFLDRP